MLDYLVDKRQLCPLNSDLSRDSVIILSDNPGQKVHIRKKIAVHLERGHRENHQMEA